MLTAIFPGLLCMLAKLHADSCISLFLENRRTSIIDL